MILVDTSIWITHFRFGNHHLQQLLLDGMVLCHPFIIGELACGNLRNRKEILPLLQTLPMAQMPEDSEVLQFIESKRLFGTGIGLIDVHLLISSMLSRVMLWTADKRVHKAAAKLHILYQQS